jgi:hypothetical protein
MGEKCEESKIRQFIFVLAFVGKEIKFEVQSFP